MPVAGTDETLTVDANVVQYALLYEAGDELPPGLRVCRLPHFCSDVLAVRPVALNDFIEWQYRQLLGDTAFQHWYKERAVRGLVVQVPIETIPEHVKSFLRTQYGCGNTWLADDGKYVRTAVNTVAKCVVTEDNGDFRRQPRQRNRPCMVRYLQRELGVHVLSVDEACRWSEGADSAR